MWGTGVSVSQLLLDATCFLIYFNLLRSISLIFENGSKDQNLLRVHINLEPASESLRFKKSDNNKRKKTTP